MLTCQHFSDDRAIRQKCKRQCQNGLKERIEGTIGVNGQFIMNQRVRSRGWVFTINNWVPQDVQNCQALKDQKEAKYLIVGDEVGEQGTPHLQGYVYWNEKRERSTVSRWLNGRAFLAPAKAGPKENWEYCSKQGKVLIEHGNPKGAMEEGMERSREKRIQMATRDIEVIKGCRCINDLYVKVPHLVITNSSFNRCVQIMNDEVSRTDNALYTRELSKKNFWLWGDAGTGKSRFVHDYTGNPLEVYSKEVNGWWDGYLMTEHKVVLVDEVVPLRFMKGAAGPMMAKMKKWADRFPFTGEIKGSSFRINPGRYFLFICSNYSLDDFLLDYEVNEAGAFKRRFTECHFVKQPDGHLPEKPEPYNPDLLIK